MIKFWKFCWHQWGEWFKVDVIYVRGVNCNGQWRYCEKCGKAQYRTF